MLYLFDLNATKGFSTNVYSHSQLATVSGNSCTVRINRAVKWMQQEHLQRPILYSNRSRTQLKGFNYCLPPTSRTSWLIITVRVHNQVISLIIIRYANQLAGSPVLARYSTGLAVHLDCQKEGNCVHSGCNYD